ncbi:MAG: hypothetical protein GF330_07990 [Candidatus Eisenbacteria bacterium]|nr:hypothetical protein [Candidatus Eisenbacteria bacterium]
MVLWERIRYQESAVGALREAHAHGRLAHAYLFWGLAGVGKLRAAVAFAQTLMCNAGGAAAPCGQCRSCEQVARLTHPDLHIVLPARRGEETQKAIEEYARDPYHCLEISPGASIGIERVRGLKVESSKARVETGSRVIILRDAERMTIEAAQAALKLIEEPHAETYLALTCRDPAQLLPTIVSRCQRLRFRPLPQAFIEKALGEACEADQEQVRLISGLARGSLGRALQMCGQDLVAVRRAALELFERPLGDAAQVAERVRAVERTWDGRSARATIDLLMSWYADVLAVSQGVEGGAITHTDLRGALQRRAQRITVGEIRRRIDILEELAGAIERNVNPGLALQEALTRIHRIEGTEPRQA